MDKIQAKWRRIKYMPALIIGYLLARMFKKFIPNNIVLVGGHMGELFDDNAKSMYEYIYHNSHYLVYWCYSPQRRYSLKTIPGDHFLKLGSLKNYIIYFNAKICFYSHSNSSDIAPLAHHLPVRMPFRVYLSHGVEGLKKKEIGPVESADLYPCTSNFEQVIKCNDWGISPSLTKITGIARYDHYNIKNSVRKPIKTILYLPTWRDWEYQNNEESFKHTTSYVKITSFLKNQRLVNFLKQKNITLIISLHPFFLQFKNDFEKYVSSNISLASTNISDLIISSDALITDYSSIAFDFFYLKKPIIFYQYDQKKFLNLRGSYIKYDSSELFGEVCTQENAAVKAVKKIVAGNFEYSNNLRNRYFTFSDQHNCERILDEVTRRINNGN